MRLHVILFLMKTSTQVLMVILIAVGAAWPGSALALDPKVLDSVVRIKPDWSMAKRGTDASGAPRDPQGTGIAVMPGGYVATNVHVIGDARNIDVMTEDGRVLKAEIVGRDKTTDIALLKVPADLPVPETAAAPALPRRGPVAVACCAAWARASGARSRRPWAARCRWSRPLRRA